MNVSSGERILKGAKNWWFVGPGGVARLRARHLTPGGALQPGTERRLRESGLLTTAPVTAYSLTVLTSTDCNLGCGYCFQNTSQDTAGGSRPPRIAHARLTPETVTSILRFTDRQMAAAGLDKLKILLFGGEPLLNPRGCMELLSRAVGHGLTSASMISNLTLLTPLLARRLEELRLKSVQVTFDGDREDHDRIRVRRSHGGTFDTIVRNIARASEVTSIRWTLRVNVSHHTFRGVDALVDRLAAALDPSRCGIYFAQVGDVGIGYANDLTPTGELAAGFARWQRSALDRGFSVSRPRAHLPCATCGYGDGRYGAVVNADGTLSSCWETAGKPGWEVGSVAEGYLPGAQTRERWISCADLYRNQQDERALAAFRDAVDAALLDHLDETGRL
ncbi:radical SAM protein [Microbispora triticiradicis]|uniref:Radical SAM protein n=1 Tax=Microbispora triticiradicis TaxID=2200763 RepID=A0ABX9LRD3_9ACTN|nr:radical SAM protein [Microbispora triticiradicis]RGA06484.1 radical SAM protein [Microbispora triticiradicis]GLW22277.1 radical SAM/SPASM domain-containing protein [Microbispora amethystogenes]